MNELRDRWLVKMALLKANITIIKESETNEVAKLTNILYHFEMFHQDLKKELEALS